jgi:hypothetical protein
MGTRHHQTVIDKNGKLRLSQYGQWDGYPKGQGIDILEYLRTADLEKYQNSLSKIKKITKKQGEEIDKLKDWAERYPYLSRDCGAKIHKLIEEGKVEFVGWTTKLEANKWCVGFYEINFKKRTFTTRYYDVNVTVSLDKLPTNEEYIEMTKSKDEYNNN